MKNKTSVLFYCLLTACLWSSVVRAQTSPTLSPFIFNTYPWKDSELIEPKELATMLKDSPGKLPVILNIGAVEDIKGAKHIGAVSADENMTTLKNTVAALPKSTVIVIYCGCCPFTKCPNIRPAFIELKKIGFMNIKLLDLPTNLQTNWKTKGYPLAGKDHE
ncbi:rhodanese-like domain-containing protein [Mucilaginibacter flavidus]|uniref:rhodanese-like domain-containing protein n=1 Tax=Mucilaginibacter flavidus TaxID=2949309 RepID=UPI0020925CFB|nr:rhodanese-like domain-containing protein [Mucilaginibacter flavidus]MCO5946765.1 rhodanese-like domain-containing protein [Mucilaginibacter flavidus]